MNDHYPFFFLATTLREWRPQRFSIAQTATHMSPIFFSHKRTDRPLYPSPSISFIDDSSG
uniref:Uncharacterized protein n=1 Tax=Cucumis melo TaxID=3656 RepID=A0A9I9E5J5_CUCME